MSGSITITISLFGAFRPYNKSGTLELEAPKGVNIAEVKNRIKAVMKQSEPEFNKEALMDKSVIADETKVLAEDSILTESVNLAILPPVCGG